MTNALAYITALFITSLDGFVVQAYGGNAIRLFSSYLILRTNKLERCPWQDFSV